MPRSNGNAERGGAATDVARRRRGLGPQAANAITGLRILLTPLFLWAADAVHTNGGAALPVALYAIIAASDFADGRVARRFGSASERGRMLDHFADVSFLVSALALYTRLGVAPWWVPASVAASFVFYVVDSWRRSVPSRPRLLGSRVGHAAGVLNYALVGVLVVHEATGRSWIPPASLTALFALVPVYSAAAVATRLERVAPAARH